MTMQLVLLRHGQSEWNLQNLFTGWHDVGLTDQGRTEAADAGRLLAACALAPDVVHTSMQKRAIHTAQLALAAMDRDWVPVARNWRINERHYGALQGLDKKQTVAEHGEAQVHLWRRSYDVPPPPLEVSDPRHPANDPRYRNLAPDVLPATECLKDVVARVLPWWHDSIVPQLRAGMLPLVVAHGNSLRALIKHLDGISDEAIADLNLPTGVPIVYALDDALRVTHSRYLGDEAAIKAAATAVANQTK